MYFFMMVLGVVMGALLGGFGGALVGGVLGVMLTMALKRSSADSDQDEARPQASRVMSPSAPTESSDLVRRVKALELQVSALQAQVARLTQGVPAQATDEEVVDTQPMAWPDEPDQAPVPPLEAPTESPPVELPPVPLVVNAAATATATATAPEPVPPPEAWDWPDDQVPSSAPPASTRKPAFTTVTAAPAEPGLAFKDLIPERLRPLIFGGNTIVKVGVLILFLGLAFLLKYVAAQVTVPVELRYMGVALLGAGLLGLGWRLRGDQDAPGAPGYGLILQGAGVGVFYLTTLAAMKLHPLLPVGVGFAIMVLVTAFSALLAVMQNAPWLAMVAAAAGFATPVLVSTGSGNHIALFSYLAILDLGIMAMAWYKAWRPLNLIGFVGTFTLAAAWADRHYTDQVYPSTQGFLLLFFLMFTAIGVMFARRSLALGDVSDQRDSLADRATQALKQVGRVDSALVFGVPLVAYGLQYQMVDHDRWGPAIAAMVMGWFYLLLGGALWRGGRPRYDLLGEAYVVVGVLFGTLSVPLALEGEWTGATWAVEAAGMYWLGTRQYRTYTRAFAMALMAAAAVRLLTTLGWSAAPEVPLLTGSLMGLILLAGSTLAMALVHRRAASGDAAMEHPAWEKAGVLGAWALTVLSLALMPWMLLMPTWASVSMGVMALGCTVLALRLDLPVLRSASVALHGAALLGFASTWHQQGDQAMLANGVEGLIAALLIALTLLGDAWLSLRQVWQAAVARGQGSGEAPVWPLGSSLALCLAVALIGVGLLFVMPMAHAALVWPVLGLGLLWVALKLAHPALSLMWAALTAASALTFLVFGPAIWAPLPVAELPLPWPGLTGGLAWWTPLVLAVCTVLAGDWLQADARRNSGWRMSWVSSGAVQVGMVGWSLVWWWLTLLPEVSRELQLMHLTAWWPACVALWVTVTAALMVWVAHARQWRLMGQASALAIPGWYWAALLGPAFSPLPPSADLGWLAWPLALCCGPWLLRRLQAWLDDSALRHLHVLGFWLMAALLCRQAQWATDQWATPGSGWQSLCWILVPASLVLLVSSPRAAARWPLRDFAQSYRVAGALPLVAGLVLWLLHSLVSSGRAQPLPYVPVLNPLELGQCLVVLTLVMWVRELPASIQAQLPEGRTRLAALGGLAWLVITTMVLRACHHWADVPWDASALFQSKLTQASLSVVWALLGVGLMIRGHRQVQRAVWVAGAGLLGVVVGKLFFLELADHGGLYRIISFIVVGLLLLVVGYFAPVPPDQAAERAESEVP